jgi:SUMO ligase MMS21 Smc5/6 complex component
MAYTRGGGKGIYLDLRLSYFNTSSSRAILEMLRVLKNLQNGGTEITVNWHYPNPDDDEILMEGEDFQEECGLAINMVEYELD